MFAGSRRQRRPAAMKPIRRRCCHWRACLRQEDVSEFGCGRDPDAVGMFGKLRGKSAEPPRREAAWRDHPYQFAVLAQRYDALLRGARQLIVAQRAVVAGDCRECLAPDAGLDREPVEISGLADQAVPDQHTICTEVRLHAARLCPCEQVRGQYPAQAVEFVGWTDFSRRR